MHHLHLARTLALVPVVAIACGGQLLAQQPDHDAGVDGMPVDAHEASVEDSDSTAMDAEDEPDGFDGFVCGTITHTGSAATAFHIDAAHDGAQPSDHIALPLCKRWSATFTASPSYPVVAGGRVFVTVPTGKQDGTNLYALDETTGVVDWGPILVGATYWWASLTYEAGNVFALNGDCTLTSFDAVTGTSNWSHTFTSGCDSPPTAWSGKVYFSTNGYLYAVNASDGTEAWHASILGAGTSSPAVDSTGAYASYGCNQAYAFDPGSGSLLWHDAGSCFGGGGQTTALHAGVLFVRDFLGHLMLSASTGASLGVYSAGQDGIAIPTFAGNIGFLVHPNPNYHLLQAFQISPFTNLWSFGGDGYIVTAPVVVGSQVVVGSSQGKLFVVDAATGTLTASDDVGVPLEAYPSLPTGLAMADGMLFVPVQNGLVAY